MMRSRPDDGGSKSQRRRIALDGQLESYRMWEMNNQMSPLQPLRDFTIEIDARKLSHQVSSELISMTGS